MKACKCTWKVTNRSWLPAQSGFAAVNACSPGTVHRASHRCQPELPSANWEAIVVHADSEIWNCRDGYCWNKVIWIPHLLQNFCIYILLSFHLLFMFYMCRWIWHVLSIAFVNVGIFFFSNKKAVLWNIMHALSVLQLNHCQVSKQEPSGSFQPYSFKTAVTYEK